MTLRADEKSVYGKKVRLKNWFGSHSCNYKLIIAQGKEGIIIVKTHQAILIAHYPETIQPGQATLTVENLGDYLMGVGY